MMPQKSTIIAALFFPILALASLAGYHGYSYYKGKEFVLPIEGYDPRDLLSGHYLIYTIDYQLEETGTELCPKAKAQAEHNTEPTPRPTTDYDAYVCLEPREFSRFQPNHCRYYVKGRCEAGRFNAGLERFYVPETRAKELEQLVLKSNAEIVLAALPKGRVVVKALLIDGKPFAEVLEGP